MVSDPFYKVVSRCARPDAPVFRISLKNGNTLLDTEIAVSVRAPSGIKETDIYVYGFKSFFSL